MALKLGWIAALFGCGASSIGDFQVEYSETIRELGYVPVYPPREDFLVGQVFFYSYPEGFRDDPSMVTRFVFAEIPGAFAEAVSIAARRPQFTETLVEENNVALAQQDLTSLGSETTSLPLVAFPTVSFATANAFGIARPLGLFAGSSSRYVAADFSDVRHLSYNHHRVDRYLQLVGDATDQICQSYQTLSLMLEIAEIDCKKPGIVCGFAVITDTYVTRKITYRALDARGIFASTIAEDQEPAPAAAPQVSLNITIPPSSEGAGLDGLAETAAALQGMITNLPGSTVASSVSSSTFGFDQVFSRPVAIAYRSLDIQNRPGTCSSTNQPSEG